MSTPFWRSAPVENPESSIRLRSSVLTTVLIATLAIVNEGLVGSAATIAALVGIPIGFWWSHARRHRESALLKLGIAVALIFALVGFVGHVRSAPIVSALDVQVPLAELFLWVQLLHSLHMPARRDLMFSLASSVVIIALASVLSVGMGVGVFLLLWVGSALFTLQQAHLARLAENDPLSQTETSTPARSLIASVAGVLAVAALVFLIAPAARTLTPIAFPAELSVISRLLQPGGFSNPSLGGNGDGTGDLSDRASFGYFGFADQLDTSLRGRPDDTLVMRVRASAPAFWRGQTFDVWDGRTWSSSDDDVVPISGDGSIRTYSTDGDDLVNSPGADRFVQTFYIERPGPNLIFGAYRIDEVFFTERSLFQTTDGSLRTGVNLGGGSIYTVVSERTPLEPDFLRAADPLRLGYSDSIAERYLQLPEMPDRIRNLAEDITRSRTNTYDKVLALEAWMADNTSYSLDIPIPPQGADAVDHFLFEERRGFCEQIGTSLVVLLRSLGIPARLVIGYIPGERNPFTGLYEVKASDAHSWTEVYFPGYGWQGFDPTAEVPLYDGEQGGRAGSGLLAFLMSWIDSMPSFVGPMVRVLAGGAIVIVVVALAWRAHVTRQQRLRRSWHEKTLAAFEDIGTKRGRTRKASETPLEYLTSLEQAGVAGAGRVGELVTAAAFGDRDISPDEAAGVRELVAAHGGRERG